MCLFNTYLHVMSMYFEYFTLYFAVYINICLFNILHMTLNIVEWMTEWYESRVICWTEPVGISRGGPADQSPILSDILHVHFRHSAEAVGCCTCWEEKGEGDLSRLCRGKKTEKKENVGLVTIGRKVRGGILPVSLEHEPRYSGGTRTLEARISLKCSHIKAHRLSSSFLISPLLPSSHRSLCSLLFLSKWRHWLTYVLSAFSYPWQVESYTPELQALYSHRSRGHQTHGVGLYRKCPFFCTKMNMDVHLTSTAP